MLIASDDARLMLKGVPVKVPALVHMLVPGRRRMPERPGSMIKVMVEGAMPADTCVINAALVLGTLKVSLPLPRLLILSAAVARPRWHSSMARKTVVVSGCRMG